MTDYDIKETILKIYKETPENLKSIGGLNRIVVLTEKALNLVNARGLVEDINGLDFIVCDDLVVGEIITTIDTDDIYIGLTAKGNYRYYSGSLADDKYKVN